MAVRPVVKGVSKVYTTVGMLKALLGDENNELIYNQELVQQLEENPTTQTIRECGQWVMGLMQRRNQFSYSLVNMIGLQRIQYIMWTNPWQWAKRGKLEMGETVEHIWEGLSDVYGFNPEKAETGFLKRTKPNINTAFYRVNYAVVYNITIDEKRLQRAFTSMDGVIDLVESLIASTGRSANIDEFAVMKYTLAVTILDGGMKMINIPALTKATASDAITAVTSVTNDFQFPLPGKQYNRAGVENVVSPENIMILETTNANALIKVNVLADAFNIEEVKFMGNVIMHDGLGNYDWKRMAKLFSEDPTFKAFTQDEITKLNSIELIAMDRQYMQIYDNYEYMSEPLRNGSGAFENYFYHVSKVLATSPFHCAVGFTSTGEGTITITLSPATATASPYQQVNLQADVKSSGFQDLGVTWSCTGGSIDETNPTYIVDGILYIGNATSKSEITVTATSNADSTKTATATITVA